MVSAASPTATGAGILANRCFAGPGISRPPASRHNGKAVSDAINHARRTGPDQGEK
jgi:hypothetical protein